MARTNIVGAGHRGDPFQVQILLEEGDLDQARSGRGLILDVAAMSYDADPQIRSVIVSIADPDGK
jgi:hypothetical protein